MKWWTLLELAVLGAAWVGVQRMVARLERKPEQVSLEWLEAYRRGEGL